MAGRTNEPHLGKGYAAQSITVFYNRSRCRHYAECIRGLPEVFNLTQRPWIRPDSAEAETIAEVVRRCPTGALHYELVEGEPEEPGRPTSVTLDPDGPILVRGDLVIDLPEGRVHETRAALCRCGATTKEPFCDGVCGVDEHRWSGHKRSN
jgi:uncharacterized Fe-S cluster protein YjdI